MGLYEDKLAYLQTQNEGHDVSPADDLYAQNAAYYSRVKDLHTVYAVEPGYVGKSYTPIYGPYQGKMLFCVRCDDGRNDWFTVGAGGCVGTTPWKYCRERGVPVTLGICVGGLGTTGYLTADQLRTLVYEAGFEVAVHGYELHTPSTTPTTDAQIQHQVVEPIAALNQLSVKRPDDTTKSIPLGVRVKGFYSPGDWTQTTDSYVDSVAKMSRPFARAILQNYEWASAWYYSSPCTIAERQRYWSNYGAYGDISAYLADATPSANPNRKNVVTVNYHALPTSFKADIDALVAARDAGRVELVTQTELWHCLPFSPITSTQKYYLPYGDIDSWAESGALTATQTYYGTYYCGTGCSIEGESPNKWFQLSGANAAVLVQPKIPEFRVGTPMTLRFRAKATGASATLKWFGIMRDKAGVDVQTCATDDAEAIALTGTEKLITRRFILPDWANTNRMHMLELLNVNAGEGVQIKDIEVF